MKYRNKLSFLLKDSSFITGIELFVHICKPDITSRVFIRFSDPGADPWNAVKTGYEIQMDDLALPDGKAEHKTGAIYDIVPPVTLASKHVGEWNTFEIHAMGQNYTVILNEITVIPKFSGTRLRRGYIGIQNHDAESHVLFRNIRI